MVKKTLSFELGKLTKMMVPIQIPSVKKQSTRFNVCDIPEKIRPSQPCHEY